MGRRSDAEMERLRDEFADWSVLSEGERRVLRLPPSQGKWSEQFGVREPTLRSWRERPDWPDRLRAAADRRDAALAAGQLVASDEPVSESTLGRLGETPADMLERLVLQSLELALEGNKDAISFVKSTPVLNRLLDKMENAGRLSFPNASDGELVGRLLDAFEDLAVEGLRERGWMVARG